MLLLSYTIGALVAVLIILGLVCHQITYIITVSRLFRDVRSWVHRTTGEDSNWSYLVGCHLCASVWISLLLAAVAIYEGVQVLRNVVTDFLILTFLISFVARVANEALAYMEQSVAFQKWRVERDKADYERANQIREIGRQLARAAITNQEPVARPLRSYGLDWRTSKE